MVSQSAKRQKTNTKMSKRGRPRTRTTSGHEKQSVARPTKHVEQDRESADRIAAAEAMSALSSLVILPNNPGDISGAESVEIKTEIDDDSDDAAGPNPRQAKRAGAGAPKRGKPRSRGRGGRRESPRTNVDLIANQKTDKTETRTGKRGRAKNSNNSSNKQVTQQSTPSPTKNNATLIAANLNKMVQQNLESQNKALKNEESSIHKSQLNTLSIHPSVKTSLHHLIQLRQLGIDPSNIQLPPEQLGKDGAENSGNPSELLSSSFLRLPLTISASTSGEKTDRKCASPSSTASNDSIELTQSAVDSILLAGVKHDSSHEASLPLKKRRLQAYQDGEEETKRGHTVTVDLSREPDQSQTAGLQATLTSEGSMSMKESRTSTTRGQDGDTTAQQGNTTPSGGLKSGINVDPRTSLMLLNEVQMALRQDEDGDLPLHIAVVHENIVMVQKFVHLMSITGKSVDKYNKAQQTPLHLAIELKFEEAVKVLLLAGANPNLVNRHGESAVHMVVKLGCVQILYLLLTKSHHKVDVNCRDFQGLSPLHVAVMKNNMQSVKLLLRAGADINMQDGKSGRTSLFYAVEAENMEMVKFLQSSFANIEMTNYAGITAIMTAQARGYSDIASMLLRGLDTKSYMEHKEKEKVLIPKEKKVRYNKVFWLAGGYSDIASMLLRGLDTKSYMEHKEKEKVLIPKEKKMPLPRIPSKSHLIVPENGTPATKVQRSDYYPESSTSHQVSMVTEDDAEAHSSVEPESSEVKDISERSNIPSFHGVKLKLHPIADKLSIVYYTNQAGQNVIVGKMCGTQFIGIPTLNSTAKANAQRESFINSQPSVVDVNIEREEEVTALASDGEGEGHTGREVVEEEENEVMDLTMSRSGGSDQKSNYKTNSQSCHSVDSYVRDMGQQSSTGEATSNNSRHYMDDVNHVKHNAEPGAGTNSMSSVVNDHKISDVQHNPVTNNASPSTGPKQNTAVSETTYFPANNISADGENISILQQRAAIISSILRNTAILTNHQVYPLPVIPKAPEKASNSDGPRVKVEREPQVSPLCNRGSHVVVDKEVDNNGETADIHERVGHGDSVQNEITESPRKTKSGKERKSIKKEKSIGGAKNRPKETKKEDKTAVRSKSPTLRTDNNGKTKEGIVAPKPANQSFGNITNITASVASSLQAKLLGMMGNKPLNLTTTDRNVSEESKTKEVPVTSS